MAICQKVVKKYAWPQTDREEPAGQNASLWWVLQSVPKSGSRGYHRLMCSQGTAWILGEDDVEPLRLQEANADCGADMHSA